MLLLKLLAFSNAASAKRPFRDIKMLNLGYDALGFYQKAYGGLRFSNFGLADLIEYVKSHRTAYPKTIKIDYDLLSGFTKKSASQFGGPVADPPYAINGVEKTFKGIPEEYLKIIKESMKHWQTKNQNIPMRSQEGVVSPKKVLGSSFLAGKTDEPVIVHEYGFRGDGRSPMVVFHSGGLHPNAIRYYADAEGERKFEEHRKELFDRAEKQYQAHKMPHFDPWLHQHNYDAISAFLSVSRSPAVALRFINMGGGSGHIYLIRSVGAIDQESTFKTVQYPGESEISLPGGIDWDDIIAVRPVVGGEPANYCYVRENNKWRLKEKDVQDKAINAMMNIMPQLDELI